MFLFLNDRIFLYTVFYCNILFYLKVKIIKGGDFESTRDGRTT